MKTDILVTGGGGLLGYALRRLLPDAIFLSRSDCELRDQSQVRELFSTLRPRAVVHLAAEVGGVRRNAAQNADLFAANVLVNTNVLEAAREFGVSKLVSMLSSCAFPLSPDRPSTERDLHRELPFEGNLGYGYSKRMLDIQTRLMAEQYGCDFSTITPVTMYGPNDNWDLNTGHVVASLIHRCFLARRDGRPLEVWGSGRAVRQFVYSPDIARLVVEALGLRWGHETVLAAADDGIRIKDLAYAVAKAMDFEGPIVFDTTKPEGQQIKVLKSDRFSRVFPDFSFTPLERGLGETVNWFVQNYRTGIPKGFPVGAAHVS